MSIPTSRPLLQLTADQPSPTTTLITVVGEIDAVTAPDLADALRQHPAAGAIVLVDLSGVAFISTTGLSILVETQRRALTTGGTLRLITGTHCVRRALEMTGLDTAFACYADPAAALAG